MPQITADTARFIDVSKWQTPRSLTWKNLPTDVSAVVMRSTYGTTLDKHLAEHFDAVVDARRVPGLYHFVTNAPAAEQFGAFRAAAQLVKFGDKGDLLPVLDLEWLPGEKKPEPTYAQRAGEMIDLVSKQWGGCIVYTAFGFWQQCGSPASWLTHPLWVAHYPGDRSEAGSVAFAPKVATPHGKGNWQMWQSGPRLIPGFSAGKIDYNYSSIPLPVIQ
jgi:GH25 family lysozyme M1 (1,4-beta-N-acetylmuramidase)